MLQTGEIAVNRGRTKDEFGCGECGAEGALLSGRWTGGRVLAHEAGIIAVIRKKNRAESPCWDRIEVCFLLVNETLRKRKDGIVKFGDFLKDDVKVAEKTSMGRVCERGCFFF